jgi:hypothetical protein
MLYKIGRFLQLVGLVLLPAAIAGEVAHKLTETDELILCGIGIAVFFAGWLLQQMSRPR